MTKQTVVEELFSLYSSYMSRIYQYKKNGNMNLKIGPKQSILVNTSVANADSVTRHRWC